MKKAVFFVVRTTIASCFLAVLLSSFSCSGDSVELKNTVTAYNKMLQEALAKPDSSIMEYFTSSNELGRIGSYILRLKIEKKIMVSNIRELDFISVSLSDDKRSAQVKTKEYWTFYYIDHKTREQITEEEAIRYESAYRLVKQDEHWVVDRVVVKEKK